MNGAGTMPPVIGKVAKTNSHVVYLCRIHADGEREQRPAASDFAFGRFVSVDMAEPDGTDLGQMIGVIVDTLIVDPDFGTPVGSQLDADERDITMPGFLQAAFTLIEVVAIGWRRAGGCFRQAVPPHAPRIGALVRAMDEDEAVRFHMPTPGAFQIDYLTFLMGQSQPLVTQVVLQKLEWLQQAFPAERKALEVVYNIVAWRSIVGAIR